jgi:hypothetical protein
MKRVVSICAVLGAVTIAAPAAASKMSVLPAVAGTAAYDESSCFNGPIYGDYWGMVRMKAACEPNGASWLLPVPAESRVGGGDINTWIHVATGYGVHVQVWAHSTYADGTGYYADYEDVATGKHWYTVPVPEDGTAFLRAYLANRYMRIESYAYEHDF